MCNLVFRSIEVWNCNVCVYCREISYSCSFVIMVGTELLECILYHRKEPMCIFCRVFFSFLYDMACFCYHIALGVKHFTLQFS